MSLEAINEQLLRSVGVGVALFSFERLQLQFCNPVFKDWFEDTEPSCKLSMLFPNIDTDQLRRSIDESGSYSAEIQIRKKRRTLVIAQNYRYADIADQKIIVLECQNISRIRELESMIDSYSKMAERNTREIQREKEQVEKLLLNVMPRSAYDEFKQFGTVAPQRYDQVTVLVLNFVNFNTKVEQVSATTAVSELNEIYTALDRISEPLGCERIRTAGDSYRCLAGMLDPGIDHLQAIINSAVRFIRYLHKRNQNADTQWECKIGLASGSCIGSVIGTQKYVFDVFGDAVHRAEKAADQCLPMQAWIDSPTEKLNSEEFKQYQLRACSGTDGTAYLAFSNAGSTDI